MTISTCSTVYNKNKSYNPHHRRLLSYLIFTSILVATLPVVKVKGSTTSIMPPLRQRSNSPTMQHIHRHGNGDNKSDGAHISSAATSTPRGGASAITPSSSLAITLSWQSKVRSVLFPIYGQDVKKFFLIGAIKFFVILALTLTRDNKDTMVVTSMGAEAIAFLKVSYVEDINTSCVCRMSNL